MSHVKITCHGHSGRSAKLEVDGVDISSMCRAVDIRIDVNSVNCVTLEMIPSVLEIDAEFLPPGLHASIQEAMKPEPIARQFDGKYIYPEFGSGTCEVNKDGEAIN